MKSLKKTLVLLVVFSMILSAVMPAFAATDIYGLDCEEEVARLEALEVVSGYDDGTFGPEKTITRAEMAVILCKMVGIDEVTAEENKAVPSKFSDVKVGEWYTGFVNVAAGKGLLSGFPDGTFRPSEQLTMNQVLTLCVNALGRGEYVSEMGAWPANYIAEATKLGLLDGVKTSDANRGNVAIIVWNTLEAPYVWDVTNTEYEGTINLGNSTRSLLSIYFRDFSYDAGTYYTVDNVEKFAYADRLLKEADYVEVMEVPSTDGELGEKQLVLAKTDDTDDYFASLLTAIKADKKPRGTDDEEWTSVNDANEIVAYAPSFEELDSYFGKIVTVIFGKDNEVISIRVIDEIVEDDFLTAYDDEKAYIGSTGYKFANDAKVFINTLEMTNKKYSADVDSVEEAMEEIAYILDIEDITDIEKVVKANVVLDSKGSKIARLDLFVSGNYEEIGTYEGIVLKVSKDVIYLSNGDKIDYKDLEEEELPRVIKDGKIVDITDIVSGNTLTYYATSEELADNMASTIYVSEETVEGKVATVRKANLAVKVEDRTMTPSDIAPKMTTKELKDSSNEWNPVTTSSVVKNDEVTLFLNIFGEYAGISLEKEVGNWQFGVVTVVYEGVEYEGEDEEIETKSLKILLGDATKGVKYTVKADTTEDDIEEDDIRTKVPAELVNKLVMFSADADRNIDYDDFYVVDAYTIGTRGADAENSTGLNATFFDEYEFAKSTEGTTVINGRRIDVDGNSAIDYRASASTSLFNLGAKKAAGNNEYVLDATGTYTVIEGSTSGNNINIDEANEERLPGTNPFKVNDKIEKLTSSDEIPATDIEIISEWESALVASKDAFISDAIMVAKKGEENAVCIALLVRDYATSDSVYAVVEVDAHETEDDQYVQLFLENDTLSTKVDLKKNLSENVIEEMFKKAFIQYTTASNKINAATALVDVRNFNKAKDGDKIGATGYIYEEAAGETQLAIALTEGTVTVHLAEGCGCGVTGEHNHFAAYYDKATSTTPSAVQVTDDNKTAINAARKEGLAEFAKDDWTVKVVCDCAVEAATPTCDGEAPAKVAYKENFEIYDIIIDKDEADIQYVEIKEPEADQVAQLKTFIVEKDELTIYDLRDGNIKTMTLSELAEEAEEEVVYVVPFFNADVEAGDANVLVIL